MPRKRMLRVEPWPKYVGGVDYPLRVNRVEWSDDGKSLVVKLVHLAEPQLGRSIELSLALPLHLEGLTAGFLRAAGKDVVEHGELDPTEAKGTVVIARFEVGPDGEARIVEFQRHMENAP